VSKLAGGAVFANSHSLEVFAEHGFIVHADRALLKHGTHRVLLNYCRLSWNWLFYNNLHPRYSVIPDDRERNGISDLLDIIRLLYIHFTHRKMLAKLRFVTIIHRCWQHKYLNNIFIIFNSIILYLFFLNLFLRLIINKIFIFLIIIALYIFIFNK